MSEAQKNAENGTLMRVRYNVLPLLDIALGDFERGKDGRAYLNGGLSRIMGYGGRGNVFKTFKMQYLTWCFVIRYLPKWVTFFDTEESAEAKRQNVILINVLKNHHKAIDPLARPIVDYFNGTAPTQFNMNNISKFSGTDWFEQWIRDPVEEREKLFKSGKGRKTAPFLNIFGEQEKVLVPDVHNCDSLSEWHSDTNSKDVMKSEVGASESNHLNMTDYNHKAQMISRWPLLAGRGEFMMGFTVQLTDNIEIGRTMGAPQQKLDTMATGIKLSGVPAKQISYLTNSLLIATKSGELKEPNSYNPDTGTSEMMFPRERDKELSSSYNDLKLVKYTQWRAKSGPTGINIHLIFSQEEGLKSGLSEWFYLKEILKKKPWGYQKSGHWFSLDILPDTKFQRKSIHDQIEEDQKLARAMTITSTIAYLYNNSVLVPKHLRMTGEELYNNIIKNGYDWDEILTKTVDWWYFDEDKEHHGNVETLTIWSLLEMAADVWEPKFLTRKKSKE